MTNDLGPTGDLSVRPRRFGPHSAGVWCTDAGPGMARRLGLAGFDWVCLDMQHGTYSRTELLAVARVWQHVSADLVVRVPAVDVAAIGLALDVGASAVIVPQVESREQARAAVAAAHYPPLGRRSAGQLGPTWGAAETAVPRANEQVVCALLIESAAAVDQIEDIAAVEGVGQLFVGPFDLSLTLGTDPHALLEDSGPDSVLTRIVNAGRANGVPVAAYAGDPATAARFADRGLDCLAVANDLWITATGAAAALSRRDHVAP